MIIKHLHPHRAMPHAIVTSIAVQLELSLTGDLCLRYELSGTLAHLKIPQSQPIAQADRLWEHTCFEAFIAVEDEASYLEYNFAPSGQWAVYAFSDYRVRSEGISKQAPQLEITRLPERLILKARIGAKDLPFNPNALPLQIGLSAVLEANDASLSYWALEHPLEHPDFHHRGGFSVLLKHV